MSNTFLSKVTAERAALAIINRKYSGNRQLSGLSSPAIEQWRSKISLPNSHQLVQTLLDLGELAQTLSNKSNESFTPLRADVKVKLDQLMVLLAAQVTTLHSEG
nr:hypothetical protein [uncultured Pseudogulbenkiania sp.]